MVPPRPIRRLVIAPMLVGVTAAALLALPLLLLAALVAVPTRRGRRRAVRLVWFVLAWLALESAALVACLGLWLASGFGGRVRSEPQQERHYALVRWFLASLFRVAVRVFRLTVQIEEPPLTPEEAAARLTRPVIVLSRHAGPGDSFLIIHHLLSRYHRRPRIVMKAALQLDPGLDVVINRLPHAFVRPRPPAPGESTAPQPGVVGVGAAAPGGDGTVAAPGVGVRAAAPGGDGTVGKPGGGGGVISEIERLAAGLGPTGALVIFPEGGNFTVNRWRRGIQRLEQSQRHDEAARARRMAHLLPPRTGGALAAIAHAPTADVIFVAHTGLDHLVTVADVWRGLPMEQIIKARWWRVEAAEIPRGRAEQARWLYDWWERIDAWIAEHRPIPPGEPGTGDHGTAPAEAVA